MKRHGIASDNLPRQAAASPQDESVAGHGSQTWSIQPEALLERVLERSNLQRALKQVRQNKGAPGIDGMSVDELPRHLKEHWLEIREQLIAGAYIVAELRISLLGWKAYFGIAEVLSPLRDIDKWLRRKLRCYIWKQWGRAGYRELRKRGVTVREAWNTSKSAHGPWRLSKTPALSLALPAKCFSSVGLPSHAG